MTKIDADEFLKKIKERAEKKAIAFRDDERKFNIIAHYTGGEHENATRFDADIYDINRWVDNFLIDVHTEDLVKIVVEVCPPRPPPSDPRMPEIHKMCKGCSSVDTCKAYYYDEWWIDTMQGYEYFCEWGDNEQIAPVGWHRLYKKGLEK